MSYVNGRTFPSLTSTGVVGAIGSKTPGPGVGGHCLPIDPSYLSWRVRRSLGETFRFVELANDVNEHMPDYVVRRLMLAFNRMGRSINGSRVLILGLAYKRNTGDAREAPGTVIARSLVALGADAALLGATTNLRYFTGISWHPSERFLGEIGRAHV